MAYLLQVDFPFEGPFGEEMEKGFWDLANSINEEEGFHWKIWTENQETKEAGGIYVFEENKMLKNTLKCTRTDLKQLVLKILE